MRGLRLLVVVLFAVSLWAERTVRGTVVDPEDRPVPGAQVRLLAASGFAFAEVRTGSAGEFEIVVPSRGAFHLLAESRGLTGVLQRVEPESTQHLTLQWSFPRFMARLR